MTSRFVIESDAKCETDPPGKASLEGLNNEPRHYYSLIKRFTRQFSGFRTLQATYSLKKKEKKTTAATNAALTSIKSRLIRCAELSQRYLPALFASVTHIPQ